MGIISNGRVQKKSHFRELSTHKDILIRALEVNSPQTNTPPLHVLHTNSIE